jgi:CBS domain-containing membrane protein
MPKVKDLMTSNLFVCREHQTLDKVEEFMKKGRIRHIPVVDGKGGLAGLLTHRDLLRVCISSFQAGSEIGLKRFLQSKTIGEIMCRKVLTTTPDTDLRDAASLMMQQKLGCLPVLEGAKLVGIITEADFLNLAWEALDPGKADEA